MKYIVSVLLMIISVTVLADPGDPPRYRPVYSGIGVNISSWLPPTNYIPVNQRYRWVAGMFDSGFHAPVFTTPRLFTGQWTGSGAIGYSTTDSSVYVYTGTQWVKVSSSGDNLYNINGILTGNRTLTGLNHTYSLTFDSLDNFFVRRNNITRMFTNSSASGIYSPDGVWSIQVSNAVAQLNANNGANVFWINADSGYSLKRISYTGNIHGTFGPYSLVTVAYGDSAWGGSSITAINDIGDATASGVVESGNNTQQWDWSTLSGDGFHIQSNSTAAGALQRLFRVSMSGVNASSGLTTRAAVIQNTHSGTTPTNIGLQVSAINGDNNYAIIVPSSSGSVGIGTSAPAKIFHTVGTVRHASLGTASTDTTTYKPLGIDSNGDVFPMTYWPGGGGGSSALNDLTDVAAPSPLHNQVIRYDTTSAQWVNDTSAVINSYGIRDNSIIKYDSVLNEFTPVKTDTINQNFEFTYSSGLLPGDSTFINRSIYNRKVDVYVAGIKQKVDEYDGYTIEDSVLYFHPTLPDGQSVYIQTSSIFIHSNIDTTGSAALYDEANGYNDITFATNTGLINTSQVFTATGAGTGLETTYSLSASQDGRLITQFFTDAKAAMLGFNLTNAEEGYSAFEAGMQIHPTTGELYVNDGASPTGVGTGYFPSNGEYIAIYRQGITFKVQTSKNKITWKDRYTYVFSSSSALYIGCDLNTDYSAKLYYPQIKTL